MCSIWRVFVFSMTNAYGWRCVFTASIHSVGASECRYTCTHLDPSQLCSGLWVTDLSLLMCMHMWLPTSKVIHNGKLNFCIQNSSLSLTLKGRNQFQGSEYVQPEMEQKSGLSNWLWCEGSRFESHVASEMKNNFSPPALERLAVDVEIIVHSSKQHLVLC